MRLDIGGRVGDTGIGARDGEVLGGPIDAAILSGETGDGPIRGRRRSVFGAKRDDGPDRRVGGIRAGGGDLDVVDPPIEAIDDQMDPVPQLIASKASPEQPPGDPCGERLAEVVNGELLGGASTHGA